MSMFYGYLSSIIHASMDIHWDTHGFLWISMHWLAMDSRSRESTPPPLKLLIPGSRVYRRLMCERNNFSKGWFPGAHWFAKDNHFNTKGVHFWQRTFICPWLMPQISRILNHPSMTGRPAAKTVRSTAALPNTPLELSFPLRCHTLKMSRLSSWNRYTQCDHFVLSVYSKWNIATGNSPTAIKRLVLSRKSVYVAWCYSNGAALMRSLGSHPDVVRIIVRKSGSTTCELAIYICPSIVRIDKSLKTFIVP